MEVSVCPLVLCHPERSCRSSGKAVGGPQQSKNHGDVSGSSPRQFGSTGGNSFRSWCRCWRVWDPSTARLLRIREAVASLRMTGVREFRANGAALSRRSWSRWLGVAFGFWPPRMRRGFRRSRPVVYRSSTGRSLFIFCSSRSCVSCEAGHSEIESDICCCPCRAWRPLADRVLQGSRIPALVPE